MCPNHPRSYKKEKRNWKIGILLLHDQLIAASSRGPIHSGDGLTLFGNLTAWRRLKKQREGSPSKSYKNNNK